MSKQKGPDSVRARGIAKEKIVTVAEGSLQPRAPGWVAPGGANVQSANIEQQGAALRSRGSLQGGGGDGELNVGSQRGAGAQQAGWSARQAGQRMIARGEEDRLNASRQSGYGGLEQQRKEGMHQSASGLQASMQNGAGAPDQDGNTAQPASGQGAQRSKKKNSGTRQP